MGPQDEKLRAASTDRQQEAAAVAFKEPNAAGSHMSLKADPSPVQPRYETAALAETLIAAFGSATLGRPPHGNCELTNICCFALLTLWQYHYAAVDDEYRRT